jgi:hypothetical protein
MDKRFPIKPKQKFEEVEIIEETPHAHLKSTRPEEVEATIEKSDEEKLAEMQQEIIRGLKEAKGSQPTEEFLSQEHWNKPLKSVFVPKNHPLMPILAYAKKTSLPGKQIEQKLRELFAYPLKQDPVPKNIPRKVSDILAFLEKSGEAHRPGNVIEPKFSKFGEACLHLMENLGSGYKETPLIDSLEQFGREAGA